MQDTFNHNFILENINSVMNDKIILRFIQDNIITSQELKTLIDKHISSSTKQLGSHTTSCLHNTMFSMCLKIILFKYLYQILKIEFLEQWPDSYWVDLVKTL